MLHKSDEAIDESEQRAIIKTVSCRVMKARSGHEE